MYQICQMKIPTFNVIIQKQFHLYIYLDSEYCEGLYALRLLLGNKQDIVVIMYHLFDSSYTTGSTFNTILYSVAGAQENKYTFSFRLTIISRRTSYL